jgi:hypothetical protein
VKNLVVDELKQCGTKRSFAAAAPMSGFRSVNFGSKTAKEKKRQSPVIKS